MKRIMKGKALVILMSLTMIFTVMPMIVSNVYADSLGISVDDINYVVNDDGTAEVSYTENLPSAVTIPETVEYEGAVYTVTSIGQSAFISSENLKSITIPNSVTSIGIRAFEECKNLETIIIPNSVTSIGQSAFLDCENLKSITIPNSVTSIGVKAFQNSGLKSITFESGSSLTSISNYVFDSCKSLTTITIPKSVTSIGEYVFRSCESLTAITIPNSVASIGDRAFYQANLESISFESGSCLTSFGDEAFWCCERLMSIMIPKSVTSIGEKSFWATGLESVTFESGSGLISIGEDAFSQCDSLTSITIPKRVTSIGNGAFRQSGLESVTFESGSNLTSIGEDAFSHCGSLTAITIPKSVTFIDSGAFNSSGLKDVTFESGSALTTIVDCAFGSCKSLKTITIPKSVTYIGTAFEESGLESIAFESGSGLTSIASMTFYSCKKLTSITIPKGVTSIGSYAFQSCENLKTVTIPRSVTRIKEKAFDDCEALDVVYFEGTETEWNQMPERDPNWAGNRSIKVIFLMIEVPEGKTLVYNGKEQTGVAAGTGYRLYGTVSATSAGSYQATAILDEKYTWADGTAEPKIINWKINKAAANVTAPIGKTFAYDGKEKTGADLGSNYTLTGTIKATEAGSYTAKAVLNTNANYTYAWADGTTEPKIINWKINKAAINVTAPIGKTFTYDGKEKTGADLGNYYTLTGTIKATEAGSYAAKAVLNTNANYTYAWADGTTAAKSITWKIDKAKNSLKIKAKKATVKFSKLKKKNQTVAVTRVIKFTKKGQGRITYSKASGSKKITVNKKTGKVTVEKGLTKGTYKVKVKVKAAGNANYKASAWKAVTFRIQVK